MNKQNSNTSVDTPPSLAMIRLITSFWVLRAIYIAAKLGVADLLKDESKEIGELARPPGATDRRCIACYARSPA